MMTSLGPQTALEDIAFLQSLVHRYFVRPRVIEVGSWLGRTALAMLDAGAGEVHCIDTWLGTPDPADATYAPARELGHRELLAHFCLNMGGHLGTRVFPYVGESAFWASVWPTSVDLIFIDADHSYQAVSEDIKAWSAHVRRGGIICGHDYHQSEPAVMRAVEESGPFQVGSRTTVWWRAV
jgi:predicted O-methyltransferase YrrM